MRRRLLMACSAVALGALAGLVHAQPSLTLEELTRGMAGSRGVVASFHETKELALLDAPLESRGTLYFIPPDRMARVTTDPAPAVLVVQNGRVTYRDSAGGEDVDLAENPVARAFIDNLIVLFNGDLAELRKRYEVRFEVDDTRWELALTPKHAMARRFLAEITLTGVGPALQTLVTRESDGDRTTTTFDQVDADHAFTPDEIRKHFHDGEP